MTPEERIEQRAKELYACWNSINVERLTPAVERDTMLHELGRECWRRLARLTFKMEHLAAWGAAKAGLSTSKIDDAYRDLLPENGR